VFRSVQDIGGADGVAGGGGCEADRVLHVERAGVL
jgi:hypothetical protein